jgi:hypothetical protein
MTVQEQHQHLAKLEEFILKQKERIEKLKKKCDKKND